MNAIISKPATKTSAKPAAAKPAKARKARNIVVNHDDWLQQLDMIGALGDPSEIEDHLARAPEDNDDVRFAAGYVAAARVGVRMSDDIGGQYD